MAVNFPDSPTNGQTFVSGGKTWTFTTGAGWSASGSFLPGGPGKVTPYILAQSGAPLTVGAVTTEVVLATITVPGGAMGPNGWLDITTAWATNNNANSKWPIVRAGGTGGAIYLDTDMPSSVYMLRKNIIANTNSQSAQNGLSSPFSTSGSYGSGTSTPLTSTVNTAANWDLVIAGRKVTSAADTLILVAYTVVVHYGA